MATCGSCGNSESKIGPDEDGCCGKCHGDHWVEMLDFFEDEYIGYTSYDVEFLKKLIKKIKTKTIGEFLEYIIDSEINGLDRMIGIRMIFEDKFTPSMINLLKI